MTRAYDYVFKTVHMARYKFAYFTLLYFTLLKLDEQERVSESQRSHLVNFFSKTASSPLRLLSTTVLKLRRRPTVLQLQQPAIRNKLGYYYNSPVPIFFSLFPRMVTGWVGPPTLSLPVEALAVRFDRSRDLQVTSLTHHGSLK